MFGSMKFMLERAAEGHYAVPHFNVWNEEMLLGVMKACEETQSPVILSFGSGCGRNVEISRFAPMLLKAAVDSTVPTVIHWDHGRSFEIIKHAYDCGFNALMIDGSSKPFEENIAFTKEATDFFHPLGIPIEAELGHVASEMKYEEALKVYEYTNPDQAKRFVEETHCDFLAVAIGNIHGHYSSEPQIAFDILEKVRDAVKIPLVLHGGSGIGDDDIRKAISLGVTKINVHTELRDAAKYAFFACDQGLDYQDCCLAQQDGVYKKALQKIELFGSANKAGVKE